MLGADPDPWQRQALAAYDRARTGKGKRRISIRSGHLVGKTCFLAWIAVHHFLMYYPQKTICTAASEDQLKDGLIAEIKIWIAKLPKLWQDAFLVKMERIERPPAPDEPAAAEESFIAFLVSRKENPESLAGRHSSSGHVLLICDEASGIPDIIFESASGSMADQFAVMVLAGNPVRSTGVFHDSQTKQKDQWETFHVSAIDSPRASRENIEFERVTYGERSNRYRIRVLGEFAVGDDDTIIPYELAEMALNREVMGIPGVRPIWGVDVAYFGQDANALAKRRGNVLVQPVKVWYGVDTMITTGKIKAEWDQTPEKDRPSDILVDSIGYGAGVADRLRELQLPARGINVSESPSAEATYKNLRTELWFKTKHWLEKRDCNLCKDQELMNELVAPKFRILDSTGLMMAESKADMKSRGIPSPNRADAFNMTMAVDHATGLHGRDKKRDWKTPLQRIIRGIV